MLYLSCGARWIAVKSVREKRTECLRVFRMFVFRMFGDAFLVGSDRYEGTFEEGARVLSTPPPRT